MKKNFVECKDCKFAYENHKCLRKYPEALIDEDLREELWRTGHFINCVSERMNIGRKHCEEKGRFFEKKLDL